MSSIEEFFRVVKRELEEEKEITTKKIEGATGMKRSLTSLYLNQLVAQNKLKKSNTRPVKFSLVEKEDELAFVEFIGSEESMKKQIEQCKSAVTYPPNGLPVLLHGSSGVGKSHLAKLIYHYAIQKKMIGSAAPFVVLNCADYANNKELLTSLLFGYVKGAFSGAEQDTEGLISEAEGGFLFLDEVHNLSAENQEKLFLLMDEKKYRPLGSNASWKSANVRLIMATTEEPESSLLTTLNRRIPFEILLPDFCQRSFSERYNLVTSFLYQESEHLKCSIIVDEEYVLSLVNSNYKGNIGEIRNKIKATCAEKYNKLNNQNEIRIGDHPTLLIDESHQTIQTGSFRENYASINFNYRTFKQAADLSRKLVDELYLNWLSQDQSLAFLFSSSSLDVYFEKKVIQEILEKNGIKLKQEFIEKIVLFTIIIQFVLNKEEIRIRDSAENRYTNHKYFKLAEMIFADVFFEDDLEKSSKIDLLSAYLTNVIELRSAVPALVIMHGEKNATTLASAVNQLVEDYVFESFDMPIDTPISQIIQEVKDYVKEYDTSDGLVLLVDMGSLEMMYKEIQEHVSGDLLIMNNVSTLLALDVGLKLTTEHSIKAIEHTSVEEFMVSKQYYAGVSQHTNLLISCISGEGIALKIKDILSNYIQEDEVELLSMDFSKLSELLKKDQKTLFKDTVAIMTTSNISHASVPVINIENIVNGADNLSTLAAFFQSEVAMKQCTNDIIKLFTLEGATERLNFLNPLMVINEVEEIINNYEKFYTIEISNFVRINLFLHLSTMIERIMVGDGIDEVEIVIENQELFAAFKKVSAHFFEKVENKYKITLPEGEIMMLYLILREQIEDC